MRVVKPLLMLLAGLVLGCNSQPELAPSTYVKWVKDPSNDLIRIKEIGGLKMQAMYQPTDYLVANALKKDDISLNAYKERAEKLSKLQHFEVKLAVTERQGVDVVNWRVSNQQESQQRINYLSFRMKEHFYLVDGQDTLPCVSFHFERSYDVAKYRTFLVGFDNKNSGADKTLVFDSPIFKTGPMKVKFQKQALNYLPKLKLKS